MPSCSCTSGCSGSASAAGATFLPFYFSFGIGGIPSCKSSSGNIIVNIINCLGLKPANNQQCAQPKTCFYWDIQVNNTCSEVCGSGSNSRIVQCVSTKDGQIVGNNNCPLPIPASTQTCNTQTCNYQWGQTEYGPCSSICGTYN
jgi:thrombospondin motif-containing protein 9